MSFHPHRVQLGSLLSLPDDYVIGLLKEGNTESIIKLMQNGYTLPDAWSEVEGLPEPAVELQAKATDFPVSCQLITMHMCLVVAG